MVEAGNRGGVKVVLVVCMSILTESIAVKKLVAAKSADTNRRNARANSHGCTELPATTSRPLLIESSQLKPPWAKSGKGRRRQVTGGPRTHVQPHAGGDQSSSIQNKMPLAAAATRDL